ncbi:substrate-binding periplasmic protein [Thalassotalea atypica]|uniref:substrate-binding periplasmic protein n=1 Tax=Thalassotalea atypica TaxID=2054316 RepID=UPI002572A2D6|nr:ABC transporter substrate-binding protein [Thalassotalea atypica]
MNCTSFAASNKPIKIVVSASTHEPYLFEDGDHGLTIDLLLAMNNVQSDFRFVLKRIPAKRVFQSIEQNWTDIVMWDNPVWGWKLKHNIMISHPLNAEKDRFIALKSSTRQQDYFDDFSGKRIVLVNGYHYQFREKDNDKWFEDPQYLPIFVKTELAALKMLITERGDIAVVSESTLNWFVYSNPDNKNKLLTSERYDREYERYFIVPQKAQISSAQVNAILETLSELKILNELYAKYGLNAPTY